MISLENNAQKVLTEKAKEYAINNDIFANFKTIAILRNITPLEALLGCLNKHLASCLDLYDGKLELSEHLLTEKFGDAFNYCVLGYAMLNFDNDFETIISMRRGQSLVHNLLRADFLFLCNRLSDYHEFIYLKTVLSDMYLQLVDKL
jgi:hypothetical protein